MNRYLPILLLIINGHFLIAQDLKTETGKSRIQGRVVDSASGISLEYATISLIRLEDKKTVNGTVTDAKGAFSIQGVAQGKYRLLVESIGYASKYINGISVNGRSDNIDLKNIAVQKSQQTLQGITVTAPPKLIENKIDKLVYNAEKDITSQSGVATDILKKVPQVSVDVDGNVELAGSTSIRFLIDGKPSTAFGSNIADVLQAIPASQIKSIEVITNPGAKYDAQGLGGIINIILKKSNKQGINSNLSLSLGTRQENGSFNFNAHKNKVGINAFFSGNARLNSTTPFSANRQSYDSTNNTYVLIQQDGSSEFRRHGFQTGIGFDAALSDHNNISGSVSYNNFGNNSHGLINQYQSISNAGDPAELISEITTANQAQNSFSDRNIDANLNYKRTFKKEDQELEFNINTSFGNNQNTAGNNQYLQPEDSLIYGTDGKNKARENIQEYTADYTHPFGKKVKLGVGAKWSVYDINSASDIYSFQNTGKEFLYDSSLSISLKYRQNVYAVYSELSFPVSNWFTAKIGEGWNGQP